MPARKNPNGPTAREINHGHPEGSKLYACHAPPKLARKIDWLLKHYQSMVPVQVRVAAILRKLLEEAIDKHLPADVLARINAEEKDDATKKKTRS